MSLKSRVTHAGITLLLIYSLLSCYSGNGQSPVSIDSDESAVSYELIAGDFEVPWGLVFLPDGDWLVTERKGEIWRVSNGMKTIKIEGVPEVYARGQGGLMDIELHPGFEANSLVYISYSTQDGPGSGGHTAIMRAKLQGNKLEDQQVLYKGEPNTTAGAHFGSRLEFDKAGYLYFSIGDRRNRDVNPQDITRDGGKIYRTRDSGKIPDDNPFVQNANAKAAIYSYGHRNPQGMVMNPADGTIWTHEHGPQGGDEVNIIEKGKNYGWPIISYGVNYGGGKFAEGTAKPGMEQPVTYWVPSIAPSGMTFVTGELYPDWKGHLLVGSLKFNYLVLCKVSGRKITSQEIVARDIGRVRDVKQGPDGFVYVAVERKGIFKLLPTK